MVDEKRPLTKEERRQRQKRLEQARWRKRRKGATARPRRDHSGQGDCPEEQADPFAAARRGRPPRPDVTAADVTGLKYFDKLVPLFQRLRA